MTPLTALVVSHVAQIGRAAAGPSADLSDAYEGLASILKGIMDSCGFDFAHPDNPRNATALTATIMGLARPDSYMMRDGRPMNPFSLVFADGFSLPLQFASWGQALQAIAGLYGTLPSEDAVLLTRTFAELAHLAASHPNNGGMGTTLLNHLTLRADDDALMLYLFRTALDVERLVAKHSDHVLTHLGLERAIFLFNVQRWRILRTQIEPAQICSIEAFVRAMTTSRGPYPRRLCI